MVARHQNTGYGEEYRLQLVSVFITFLLLCGEDFVLKFKVVACVF